MRNVNGPRSGTQNLEKILLELLRSVIQELFSVGRTAARIIYFPKIYKDDRSLNIRGHAADLQARNYRGTAIASYIPKG